MLVFPQWRADKFGLGCQRAQWVPEPRFASYVAPRHPQTVPTQIEDEYSSSSCGSSPEHSGGEGFVLECGENESDNVCEWRGCGRRVGSVTILSAHVAREHAHAQHDGLFYCGWRGCSRPHRGFNARYKMLVHVRTHTNEKPHACPQCQKCFSRAENLKIHMRSHSGEKPYICPFEGCNKAYSNSSDRFKHTRTHAVDKPYCCKVSGCDKRYTDPSSLRKHVKTYKHFAQTSDSPRSSPGERISPVSPNSIPMSPLTETMADRLPTTVNRMAFVAASTSPERIVIRPVIDERVRVPTYDMSYLDYSRMYGYASPYSDGLTYKGLLSNSLNYKSPLSDGFKKRNYELLSGKALYKSAVNSDDESITKITMTHFEEQNVCSEPDVPLNLKCSGNVFGSEDPTLRVRSIEDSMEFQLVCAMEMPLDLSNKS